MYFSSSSGKQNFVMIVVNAKIDVTKDTKAVTRAITSVTFISPILAIVIIAIAKSAIENKAIIIELPQKIIALYFF